MPKEREEEMEGPRRKEAKYYPCLHCPGQTQHPLFKMVKTTFKMKEV